MSITELIQHDISHEEWREYEWADPVSGDRATYRIVAPAELFIRDEGTTHRVVDREGVVHCVPSVGQLGCVLRWKNPVGSDPVQF